MPPAVTRASVAAYRRLSVNFEGKLCVVEEASPRTEADDPANRSNPRVTRQ